MNRIALLLLLLLGTSAQATTIQAQVDRSQLEMGESLELTIETDDPTQFGKPDLSLLKQDFDVLDSRQINHLSAPDDDTRPFTRWIIALQPKRTGTLIVPSFSLGKETSQPIRLQVAANTMPEPPPGSPPVIMVTQTNVKEAYIQQQVLVTLRIYHAIPLYNDTKLPALKLANTQVEPLGKPLTYEKNIGGIRHGVIEQRYAIYPLQSGNLLIPSLTFDAAQAVSHDTGTLPFAAADGRWVHTRSSPLTLRVKDIPAQYPKDRPWLPASAIRLSDTWSDLSKPVTSSEAVTRTVILKADGLPGNQLPPVKTPAPAGWRHYPEQPRIHSRNTKNGIESERSERQALVPEQAGHYRFPSVEITWWNTLSDRLERTVLPERELEVIAGILPEFTATDAVPPPPPQPLWPWQLATFLLGVTTFCGFFLYWRARFSSPSSRQNGEPSEQACLRALRNACQNSDPQAARQALDAWARLQPETLGEMAARHIPLSQSLDELNGALYSETDRSWEGLELWRAVQALSNNEMPAIDSAKSSLPPLYPD